MICCEKCFESTHKFLIDYIREEGEKGTCEFCESSNVMCVDASALEGIFEPLLNIYTDVNEFMPSEEMRELEHYEYYFSNQLIYDWEVFSDLVVTGDAYDSKVEDFLKSVFSNDDDNLFKLDRAIMVQEIYFGYGYQYSDEVKQHWQDFRKEIIANNRFFPQSTLDLDVLGNLFSVLSVELETKGAQWYRARKVTGPNPIKFECADMKAPPAHLTYGQRANPQGIPYLYLASDIRTCIAEIRPEILEHITTARFSLSNNLRVINLSGDFKYGVSPFGISEDELMRYLVHSAFLNFMRVEISRPYNSDTAPLEYIPTQYLTEYIKHLGYDGVLYSSSVSKGTNLVIFDQEKMECTETKLFEITDIKLEIDKREVI